RVLMNVHRILRVFVIAFVVALALSGAGPARAAGGARIYVANAGTNQVQGVDAATNTIVTSIPVGTNPYNLAFTPSKNRLYVTNCSCRTTPPAPGSVSVIDPATNSIITTVAVGAGPVGVAVSPDEARAYVANSRDSTISVI